jgi:hypothetical protein
MKRQITDIKSPQRSVNTGNTAHRYPLKNRFAAKKGITSYEGKDRKD